MDLFLIVRRERDVIYDMAIVFSFLFLIGSAGIAGTLKYPINLSI